MNTKVRLTREQEESRLRGLRILARMIVRHHLASIARNGHEFPPTDSGDPASDEGRLCTGRRTALMDKRPVVKVNARTVWDRLNMSQNDMARRLGITSAYLSRLINGRRNPSPRMRGLLQEALGSPEFDDLFVVVKRDD